MSSKKWCCSDPECLKEREKWGSDISDDEELVHCSTTDCHGVVWIEKGLQCNSCGKWYCMSCWQQTGQFNDDEQWVCDHCC